jgi:hypothetical protein
MPYPNEHAARILSPSSCTEQYGRQQISPGISHIRCVLKGTGKWGLQAIRFSKSKFSAEEARKWLKDHDIKYMSFEAASGD